LDSVHLHGMRFFSHHGVYAEETRSGQPFEVDLSLQLDLSAAARADDLSLTVDYGSAHAVVSRLVEGPPHYHLLEALSLRLIVGLLRAFPAVHAVRVTLRKPRVALPGLLSHSAVTMERRRDQLPDLDAIEREHEQRRSKRTQQQQPSST
jgi:dihydroneopterin aldolase